MEKIVSVYPKAHALFIINETEAYFHSILEFIFKNCGSFLINLSDYHNGKQLFPTHFIIQANHRDLSLLY